MLASHQLKPVIPNWLIWIQCIAFVVLYAVWILPEIVGFRNTALVVGALAGLYPIYQYRSQLFQRRAIPVWLIVALFAWATFHLLSLSQDYAAQLREYKRIWKYAAIGAIFAFGLGLSLMSAAVNNSAQHQAPDSRDSQKRSGSAPFWRIIFFGLCTPVLIYLLKYTLTTYGARWGIVALPYLQIYFYSQPYYVPKTDYVAFCLPPLAIALGQIQVVLTSHEKTIRQIGAIVLYMFLIASTLFLFDIQNIKNGMAYAAACLGLFVFILFFRASAQNWWKKLIVALLVFSFFGASLYIHWKKNDSWRTLVADTKVALQLDQYQQWKYAGEKGYPNNEFGKMVSITNYERAAWFKVGLQLAGQTPLGYGLVEDSFKRMAKETWPEVSPNLSHSHSGWLDVVLAIGIPGFTLIIVAMLLAMKQSKQAPEPWKSLVFWALFALGILWITTEVSATVTFAALIFWVGWAAGLTLLPINSNAATKDL